MNLNEMPQGATACIRSFDLEADTARRLQALGMIPGTTVKILQRKGSGTLVLDLRGTRFALGSKMTKKIEVDHV